MKRERSRLSNTRHLPFPYFRVNRFLEILEISDCTRDIFMTTPNFLNLVDRESKKKAQDKLFSNDRVETELVMKTHRSPFALFKVAIKWVDNEGYITCIEQDEHIKLLTEQVQQHRKRLAETDLELFLKKEEVENSLKKIVQLSGPIINLSKEVALIPLFGTLNEELISYNRSRLVNSLYNSSIEKIIIDFQAIGKVEAEGISHLSRLIGDFKLMGTDCYLTGVNPVHAVALHKYNAGIEIPADYISNLKEAIEKFFPVC